MFTAPRDKFRAAMASLLGTETNRGEHLIVCVSLDYEDEKVIEVVQRKVQDLFG